MLAAGGHLESREPGLATELLATALAHCPAGELPSLLDRWAAVHRGGVATLSGITGVDDDDGGDKTSIAAEGRSAGARRPSADWLARRLRECFTRPGAARGLVLLPQLGDVHLALAAVAALGLQPAVAALESTLSDGLQFGVPARAVLLFSMYASGIQALDAAADEAERGDAAGMGAAASSARQRLTLSPWAVLRNVQRLAEQLSAGGEAARAACLDYERCTLCCVAHLKMCLFGFGRSLCALRISANTPQVMGNLSKLHIQVLNCSASCRRLVLTADKRCIQQWLPSTPVDDLTNGNQERRQALLEKVADAIAANVLAGKRGGSEALEQLLTLSHRCASGFDVRPYGVLLCRAGTLRIAAQHALLRDEFRRDIAWQPN